MDFRYLLGGSELLGTHSLVEDIQRELQELRKRRQDLSSKLNAFALEFTEIEKREEELLGKLQHSPAPQEASSSVQYKMEPPMMPSHSTNHNNALSNCHLQQILGVVAGNTFSVGSALDTDTLDYASHDTPAADVTSLSAASERAHVPLDCSNAAVASATRKRPATSANSSVGKQATNKKKLSGISFEELSGHVANFHSLQ